MRFLDEYKLGQIRDAERARFLRWFVQGPMGWAYIDRSGRPRAVSEAEWSAWRARAYVRIEDMLGSLPTNAAWSIGGLLVVLIVGPILFGALEITGPARHIAMAVAVVGVEAGLIGIDIYDYWRDWHRLRDTIEQSVAGRAPLPIDPEAARIPRNWYYLGQYIVVAPLALLYFYSHFDERIIGWFRIEMFLGLALLAWGLHFAAQRHDRIAQERLRRR
jgi:hypothetical protein